MPPLSTLLVILIVLALFSAFFSASEAALIAINKVRLRHMMEKKKTGARRLYHLVSRMDKMIATVLVGNNLVNTAIAAIATVLFTQLLGEEGKGVVWATVITTVGLVIFCELIPKLIATNHPEGVAFMFRHMIHFFIAAFSPITYLLTIISHGFIRLFGGNPHFRSPLVTEEEMKMMIAIGKEEGFYGDSEKRMLERIFHFDEIEVRDVMTPLDQMTMVPMDISESELEKVILEEGHNRIPVYEGTPANAVGILYVRDLLYLFKHGSLIHLSDVISAPYFVPLHMRVAELLKEFQRRKIQIAIVRDVKTDRTVGLVTLEDLIEEIVGEIEETKEE